MPSIKSPRDHVTDYKSVKRPRAQERARSAQLKVYLTGADIAAVVRVSPSRAYSALTLGLIPGASRVGRSYRVTLDQVRMWVEAGCPFEGTHRG